MTEALRDEVDAWRAPFLAPHLVNVVIEAFTPALASPSPEAPDAVREALRGVTDVLVDGIPLAAHAEARAIIAAAVEAHVAARTAEMEAEVERLRAERNRLGASSADWRENAERMREQRDALAAQVEAVRGLHTDIGGLCQGCGHLYPCSTIRALSTDANTKESHTVIE
jgi:hypothetical protein